MTHWNTKHIINVSLFTDTLSAVMLSVIIISPIMLNVIMLNVVLAECRGTIKLNSWRKFDNFRELKI